MSNPLQGSLSTVVEQYGQMANANVVFRAPRLFADAEDSPQFDINTLPAAAQQWAAGVTQFVASLETLSSAVETAIMTLLEIESWSDFELAYVGKLVNGTYWVWVPKKASAVRGADGEIEPLQFKLTTQPPEAFRCGEQLYYLAYPIAVDWDRVGPRPIPTPMGPCSEGDCVPPIMPDLIPDPGQRKAFLDYLAPIHDGSAFEGIIDPIAPADDLGFEDII